MWHGLCATDGLWPKINMKGERTVQIDWGDTMPSARQRAAIEDKLKVVSIGALDAFAASPLIGLRRRGGGYEACLSTIRRRNGPVELRLHGDDLGSVVDRAVSLLSIVSEESRRATR